MDADLALVTGLILAGLSIPSIISTVADRAVPRVSVGVLLAGTGLVLFALIARPGGYALPDIPDAFITVIARFI